MSLYTSLCSSKLTDHHGQWIQFSIFAQGCFDMWECCDVKRRSFALKAELHINRNKVQSSHQMTKLSFCWKPDKRISPLGTLLEKNSSYPLGNHCSTDKHLIILEFLFFLPGIIVATEVSLKQISLAESWNKVLNGVNWILSLVTEDYQVQETPL